MLLPGALPDPLLFLRASWLFIAPLCLNTLLLVVLVLPLLLLSTLLLLVVLVLPLLLLGVILLSVLVLPLLLLSTLLLLVILVLPLLLLSMLLFGLGLLLSALLLIGMVLLVTPLLLLCVARSSDSEKQRQDGCASESNCFHRCCLRYARPTASFLSSH
jgi:hypothetical protein